MQHLVCDFIRPSNEKFLFFSVFPRYSIHFFFAPVTHATLRFHSLRIRFVCLIIAALFCHSVVSPFQLKNNYGLDSLPQTWFNCLHFFPFRPRTLPRSDTNSRSAPSFLRHFFLFFPLLDTQYTKDIFVISSNVFFCLKPYWMFWLKSFIKVPHCTMSNKPPAFLFRGKESVFRKMLKIETDEERKKYFFTDLMLILEI